MTSIGIIGAGQMGMGICQLISKKFKILLYDIEEGKAKAEIQRLIQTSQFPVIAQNSLSAFKQVSLVIEVFLL